MVSYLVRKCIDPPLMVNFNEIGLAFEHMLVIRVLVTSLLSLMSLVTYATRKEDNLC